MDFSNDRINDIILKKNTLNYKYSSWYYRLHLERKDIFNIDTGTFTHVTDKYDKKSSRIKFCMDTSVWNLYDTDKIMDLQFINRCMDSRFCPNCRKVDISKFICNFNKVLPNFVDEYDFFMLTLTVPNCPGDKLREVISKLSVDFGKFFRFFKPDSKKLHYINFYGGVRVLEITYNKKDNTYHPHLHCLILVKKCDLVHNNSILQKIYRDRYSTKKGDYNYLSFFDCFVKKVWTLIYYGIRLSDYNLMFYNFNPGDNFIIDNKYWLETDFVPLDEKGILEIFKYTFKDSDVPSYDVFVTLFDSLLSKRVRQGFGCLFNLKCDFLEDELIDDLDFKEAPQEVLVRSLEELLTTFKSFNKISRFNSDKYNID